MEGVKILLIIAGVVCQTAAAPQLLSAALSASGLGSFVGIGTDTQALGNALDLTGNLTRYATNMVKNVSDAGTTVARVGLNQTTALGGNALSGGIGVAKQALKFGESASKYIPGGQTISFIAPAANIGLDMVGKVGGLALKVAAEGGDKVLDTGNRVVQHKVELFNTGAQKLIGVGRKAVNTMDAVKNSVNGLSTGMTSAMGSKLVSVTSGLASTLTGSGSASGGVSTSTALSGRLSSLFG